VVIVVVTYHHHHHHYYYYYFHYYHPSPLSADFVVVLVFLVLLPIVFEQSDRSDHQADKHLPYAEEL